MRTGGDPAALQRLAGRGPGQAFTLTRTARALEQTGGWHRHRAPDSTISTVWAVDRLRRLAERILALDAWVGEVATALHAADQPPLQLGLLGLGIDHPLVRAGHAGTDPPPRARLRALAEQDLTALVAVPRLPASWRDRVHRVRIQRWLATLDDQLDEVPDTPVGLLARLADRWVVDRLSPVVDLHRTREETVSRARAAAGGVRRLLTDPDLAILSFTPGLVPTIRVARGDVDTATHVAVLLPGTGTGLHALTPSREDLDALHDQAVRTAAPGTSVATVLDLYAAPPDLGHALDPASSQQAGTAAAAFLDDLADGGGLRHLTLVGHSYGALTAARTSDAHPVDDLVLLGAPGVGVLHRDELPGATRVWAARADWDPIGLVADADELLAALPDRWRPTTGPLADPLVAHGPDPVDPAFGALRLPTAAIGGGIAAIAPRGHVDYLTRGTTSLANIARVVVGRGPEPATVSPARPPRRARRASGADG